MNRCFEILLKSVEKYFNDLFITTKIYKFSDLKRGNFYALIEHRASFFNGIKHFIVRECVLAAKSSLLMLEKILRASSRLVIKVQFNRIEGVILKFF